MGYATRFGLGRALDVPCRFPDLRDDEELRAAIHKPPSAGSQRSLVPDLIMDRADVVVVLNGKYKRHAEQIERLGWLNADDALREQHRNDVLQR